MGGVDTRREVTSSSRAYEKVREKTIIVIQLAHPDCGTHKKEPIQTILAWWETENNDKHGKHCYAQRIFLSNCSLC